MYCQTNNHTTGNKLALPVSFISIQCSLYFLIVFSEKMMAYLLFTTCPSSLNNVPRDDFCAIILILNYKFAIQRFSVALAYVFNFFFLNKLGNK